MNRNVESHFAQTPQIDIQRSQFDMSHSVKLTGNVGDCIPFCCQEVLPGDTFKVTTSKVIRLQTMLKPIMDNLYADFYWFYVPNRLLWEHWVNFCGESEDAWIPETEYSIPQIKVPADGFGVGSVADYLGVSPEIKSGNNAVPHEINALPFRGYAKIMEDWFRSEPTCDALVIPTTDATVDGNDPTADDIYCAYGGPLFKASKYHDYFTSVLPGPQSGPSVTFNLLQDTLAPVYSLSYRDNPLSGNGSSGALQTPYFSDGSYRDKYNLRLHPLHFSTPNSDNDDWDSFSTVALSKRNTLGLYSGAAPTLNDPGESFVYSYSDVTGSTITSVVTPDNLWANIGSAGNLFSVNDLRIAFQVQRFYERYARGGRRYCELLRSFFGTTSPDGRLQRSEYLGGNRVPVAIHEITNNSEGESSFLGDLGAMSHTSDVHEDFVKSFTEHGYVYGIMVLRYDHTYSQGVDRMFTRKSMFDFYWPVFANLSETPVYRREIFVDNDIPLQNDDTVFGYQEAWADYRFSKNRVCGEFRPDVQNSLAVWHLSDNYATAPSFSDEWLREDKSNVDRVLAVTSSVSNQFFADIYVNNIATRPMPLYSVPGLIDHN